MDRTKRPWLAVLATTGIIAAALLAAAIVTLSVYVFRQIDRQTVGTDRAEAEFTRVRARFVREQALVEITGTGTALVHPDPGRGGAVHTVHLLAYSPRTRHLVHAALPVWLLRLVPAPYALLDQSEMGIAGVRLTLADIEHHGPGLLLDHQPVDGAQALVWVE